MKLSRRFRSLGAAVVCVSMVLCNVPLVQAGDVVISNGTVEQNVYGNGTGSVTAKVYNEVTGMYDDVVISLIGGAPLAEPPDGNSVSLIKTLDTTGAVLGNVYGGYATAAMVDKDADSNTLIMQNGTSVTGGVYGGYAEAGDVTNNSAFIEGSVTGAVYGGYAAESAVNNYVSINDSLTGSGAVAGDVYGGRAAGGDATGNNVSIRNSSVTGAAGEYANVAGGSTVDGEASTNTVTITASGKTTNLQNVNIAGGRSVSGDVTGNKVDISAGNGGALTINGSVYGGYTVSGTQTLDNEVNISTTGTGSVSVTNVYGMYAVDADSQYNVLTFGGGSTIGSAYAGYSKNNDVHDNWITVNPTNLVGGTGWTEQANTVHITGNVDVKNVYAGYTELGGASFNLIDIQAAQENGHFYAGYTETGDAYDNHVLVNGLDVGSFHAGHSDSGTAYDNTVTITMGSVKNLYGGSTGAGIAEYNDVSVIAGRVDETIYGGYTAGGEANLNMVTIAGASDNVPQNIIIPPNINAVVHDVYGGYASTGWAGGNAVVVNNYSTVMGDVVGGYSGSVTTDESGGTTDSNLVFVNDGAIIHGDIYGGKSGAARENYVVIDGGVIDGNVIGGGDAVLGFYTRDNVVGIFNNATVGDVYGGRISTGKAVENYVIIDGSSIPSEGASGGNVYGGYTDSGWVEGNSVEISYGTLGDVYGGRANDGYANDNVVLLGHGNIGSIYGGVTNNGFSNDNEVYIENSTINGNNIVGGSTGSGNALRNYVTITGEDTTIRNPSASIIGGDTNAGDASNNLVYIDLGEVNAQQVVGGRSSSGNASNNIVDIGYSGGEFIISDVTGGFSANGSAIYNDVTIGGTGAFSGVFTDVHGGRSSGNGDASDNTVAIYNGAFTNIYGGKADGAGYARNNAVNLYGGTFNGLIYGGYSASGSATNNTVVIHPSAILAAGTRLYGGYTGSSSNDARTGNTLDIRKPIKITGIGNFANYKFDLPASFAAGDTMIAVTNGNGNGGAIDLKDATVGITVNEGSTLQQGDTVILIDEQGGNGFDGAPATKRVSSGFVNRTFNLSVVDNQLQASITGASLDERTDSIPEGFLSGLILANQGADAIAGSAMDSAMTVAHKGPIAGLGGFGSLIIGKSEYNTGSDIDMFGVSAAAGLALGADFVGSSLTLGPFFEYGKAEFDTVNSLGNDQNVIGEGDSEYMGGGFLLRMDYKDVGLGRYFAEASVRVGKQTNNFTINWPGEEAFSYKSTAPYYGIHLGYGGSWDVAQSAALDIYGKYFFARGNNSDVSTSNGDEVSFESVTSNRVRGGARMAYAPGDSFALSFGGAYEYEMSGEIKASMLNYAINAPSLKGGTGIGEVIVGYKPSPSSRTSINFGVQGYAGKRQGVTASVFIRF